MRKLHPYENVLRQEILDSRLSYGELALLTGVSNASICRFVNRQRGLSLRSAGKIMKCLGITVLTKAEVNRED